MALQPQADLFDVPDDLAELENERAEPLTHRLEQLRERIRTIPLPEIVGGESVTIRVPPKNPGASP
jgi:hypothetical protein